VPFAFRRLDQMHLPEGKAAEALCRTAVRLDVGYPPPRPARSALTAAAARALLLRVRGGRTATPVDGGRLPQLKLSLLATAVKQAWPDLMTIEQRGDALKIDSTIAGVERFGEAADDVKLVVG